VYPLLRFVFRLSINILKLLLKDGCGIKENSILSVKVSRLSDQVAVKAKAMDMFALSYPAVGQVVAMTTAPQNDAVAYVPLGDGPETGESSTDALSLATISIPHLKYSD
jgi:hypothetical protein